MSSDTYFMPRNSEESRRVDKQGQSFEITLDYQIHPDILTTLPSSPSIADVGTATGDFLIRLSKKYPQGSHFHGFDISPSLFCPVSDLPTNVKLHVHDLKRPFEPEFHGKFDLVHFRMLVAGMDKDDWLLGVRNAIDLLRPGGAIQWEEADLANSQRLRGGGAGTTAKNLQVAIGAFVQRWMSRMQYGPKDLAAIFEEAGLVGVDHDMVSTDRLPETREQSSRNFLKAAIGSMRKLEEQGQNASPLSGHTVDDIERKALEDIANGAYTRTDIYCTIGFKSAEASRI